MTFYTEAGGSPPLWLRPVKRPGIPIMAFARHASASKQRSVFSLSLSERGTATVSTSGMYFRNPSSCYGKRSPASIDIFYAPPSAVGNRFPAVRQGRRQKGERPPSFLKICNFFAQFYCYTVHSPIKKRFHFLLTDLVFGCIVALCRSARLQPYFIF